MGFHSLLKEYLYIFIIAGLRWQEPAATVNYRPVLSSERALQNKKPQLSKRKFQGERKIGLAD
jgi:hypothetical protein